MSSINTKDYREAPRGLGPLAYEWKDKPHRLVYDLCAEVERLRPEGAWTKEWPTLPGKFWVYGYPFGMMVTPDNKPKRYFCDVKVAGPSSRQYLIFLVEGQFMYKETAGPVMFSRAFVPSPPTDFEAT